MRRPILVNSLSRSLCEGVANPVKGVSFCFWLDKKKNNNNNNKKKLILIGVGKKEISFHVYWDFRWVGWLQGSILLLWASFCASFSIAFHYDSFILRSGLPWWFSGKPTCQCRGCSFYPRVRKIPWRRQGDPLQYSCLKNPTDRGDRWTRVPWVTKSRS